LIISVTVIIALVNHVIFSGTESVICVAGVLNGFECY